MQWTSLFWRVLPRILLLVKYLSKSYVAKKYVRSEHLNEVQTSTIQSIIFVRYSLVTSCPNMGDVTAVSGIFAKFAFNIFYKTSFD